MSISNSADEDHWAKHFATKGPVTRLDVTTMPQEFTRKFDVTLNGVRQRYCVIADVTKGFVVRYTTGLFGALVRGRNGVFKTHTIYGVVTITEKEPKNGSCVRVCY